METKALKVKKAVEQEVDPEVLQNGSYSGRWGGYVVRADINGECYRFDTEDGVRGIDCACTVHVENGKIRITG